MTAAVLFASDAPQPAGAGTAHSAVEVARQLRAAGADRVWVLARPDQAAALRAAGLTVVETSDTADDLRFVARLATASVQAAELAGPVEDQAGSAAELAGPVEEQAGSAAEPGGLAAEQAGSAAEQDGWVQTAQPVGSAEQRPVGSAEPVLLCTGGLVANDGVLGNFAAEPVGRSLALVAADRSRGAGGLGMRAERMRMIEVVPQGTGGMPYLGGLRITRNDLAALAGSAERAARRAAAAPSGDAADLLLTELAAAGVPINVSRVRLLYAERVTDEAGLAAARAAVAEVDEDSALLSLSVKEKDDFFATYAVSSWSPLVTRWVARLGLSPATVTTISVLSAVLAAAAFGFGSRPALVVGSVLLYLGFVLDCVDGQLARYTRRFSAFGGWLDTMADRAKEYLVYAGLAAGAVRAGHTGAWALAVVAIALQTTRHMTDTWYGALHDDAVARRAAAARRHSADPDPVPMPTDPAVASSLAGPGASAGSRWVDPAKPNGRGGPPDPAVRAGLGERLGRASDRVQANTGSLAYWLKRIVPFPIGVRWALIAVTAALFSGRVALLAVVTWGSFAAAYTLLLRSLRSRAMRVPVMTTVDLAAARDDGPLALRLLGAVGVRRAPLSFAAGGLLAAAGLMLLAAAGPPAGWWLAGAAAAVVVAGLSVPAPHDGALDWLVPAALRAVEFLTVIGVAITFDVPLPYLFGLLFALSLHFYDLTARLEKWAGAPRLRRWTLGWDGRVVVVLASAALGWASGGMLVLAGYVVIVLGINTVMTWVARPSRPPAAVPTAVGLTPTYGHGPEDPDR